MADVAALAAVRPPNPAMSNILRLRRGGLRLRRGGLTFAKHKCIMSRVLFNKCSSDGAMLTRAQVGELAAGLLGVLAPAGQGRVG